MISNLMVVLIIFVKNPKIGKVLIHQFSYRLYGNSLRNAIFLVDVTRFSVIGKNESHPNPVSHRKQYLKAKEKLKFVTLGISRNLTRQVRLW